MPDREGNLSLYEQQAPASMPRVEGLRVGTDLLLPADRTVEHLRHFPATTYSKEPEAVLVRFLRVLLGDAGAGQLRKRLLSARLLQTMQGSHFFDLDAWWGSLFGVRRRTYEALLLDPNELGTISQWQEQHYRDSSYRSRIEQFAQALSLGATAWGMRLAAEALLTVECDVHESWVEHDQGEDVARNEFTVVPKRAISAEEAHDVRRVLRRVKPANVRMHVEHQGVALHDGVAIQGAVADSAYWEVEKRVSAVGEAATVYSVNPSLTPVEQPQQVFSSFQGEAWSYVGDAAGIESYAEDAEGNWLDLVPTEERVTLPSGDWLDYRATKAVIQPRMVLAGRMASDGIVTASPYEESL